MHEAWFSDMDAVKAGVGLMDETVPVAGADDKAKVGEGWRTMHRRRGGGLMDETVPVAGADEKNKVGAGAGSGSACT